MVLPERKCPACSAKLTPGMVVCAYCSSSVVPLALSFKEREDVQRLVKRLDVFLASEQQRIQRGIDVLCAGCWAAGALVWIVLWLMFNLGFTGWIALAAYTLTGLLMNRFIRMNILPRRLIRFYRTQVEPQILRYTAGKGLPRWQFDQMACFILEEDSPLRRFMSSTARPPS